MGEFGRLYEQQYAVALFNKMRFDIEGGGGPQDQLLHRKVKPFSIPIFQLYLSFLKVQVKQIKSGLFLIWLVVCDVKPCWNWGKKFYVWKRIDLFIWNL